MSKKKPIAIVIFEAKFAGKTARAEITTSAAAINSRETRRSAEDQARIAFGRLSPYFKPTTKIKVIDIQIGFEE